MYIVCRDCQRQYDIGAAAPGSKFLCRCGVYVRVPSVTVKDAVVTRCPSCGAALAANAKACAYCASEISLAELSLGEACPKCLSRMFKGAKFCSTCGLAIRAERLDPAELGACPRCETDTLVLRPVEGGSMAECTKCSGIWLDQEFFERVVEERDERAMASFVTGPRAGTERSPISPDSAEVRYLSCPRCGERMHRKNFGRASGVIIDWCRNHGYWFDAFEIERIFGFVRGGGLDQARKREIEDAREAIRRAQDLRRETSGASYTSPGFGFGENLDRLGDANDVLDDAVAWIARGLRRLFGR